MKKKSGISHKRAQVIENSVLGDIRSVFFTAEALNHTNEHITEEITAVMNTRNAKRLPLHRLTYINGYIAARRENIYTSKLVWVVSVDEKLLTSEETHALAEDEKDMPLLYLDENYRSPWQRVNLTLSRHVWKRDRDGSPMLDKPYDEMFIVKEDV